MSELEYQQRGVTSIQLDRNLVGGEIREGGQGSRSEVQESRRWLAGHLRRDK